jgi:glycosyltransferase involved in cell wall biosynthesis
MSALRLAYVTVGAATDVHEWSGLNAAIRASLVAQGCIVSDVDRLSASYPLHLRLRKRVLAQFGVTYALDRSPFAASRRSQLASGQIARLNGVDAVVATGTTAVSQLDRGLPLALWADATYHSLRTTYPEYAAYSRASIEEGERLERAALERATLLCYASQWAADDAVDYYRQPRQKVRVIEFGANAESPFVDEAAAAAAVASRPPSPIGFAFIGMDWVRKGGNLAVEIVRGLNDAGIASVLTIAGCRPPAEVAALPFVRCLGFLSKKSAPDRERLDDLWRGSHFLLLPTLAECFGLVFAEAAAFALPSISRDVGGVRSAVIEGRTGLLMPADAGAPAYCDAIRALVRDQTRYRAMALAAYQDFQQRLNWRVAGARFTAELRALVSSPAVVAS